MKVAKYFEELTLNLLCLKDFLLFAIIYTTLSDNYRCSVLVLEISTTEITPEYM